MKIALAQINVIAKQFTQNFLQIEKMIQEAKTQNAEVIVFPALALSGFAAEHEFMNRNWTATINSFNNRIKMMSDDILIIWGNIQEKNEVLTQCAYACFNQEYLVEGLEKEVNINNRYYDEKRYFKNVESISSTFLYKEKKMGISFADENRELECEYHIVLDQTPWTKKHEFESAQYSAKHLVYVNACGMQTIGKAVWVLDGASTYYQNGESKTACNDAFQEELIFSDQNISFKTPTKLLDALTQGIFYFDQQILPFKPRWIVGLSGGLDSSISAAILVRALGKERVIGYNLATKNNSTKTIDNAKQLADFLEIEYRTGSIQEDVSATEKTLKEYQYLDTYPRLVYENLQARLRGHILSTFASVENGVVINNGNKVETALGYCTMYGDSIGAIGMLGDITKVELFELANEINAYFKKEVIPINLLPTIKEDTILWETRPSAELSEGQLDPMKWYYHDYLLEMILKEGVEEILASYLDKRIYEKEIGKWIQYYQLDNGGDFIDDLEWFLSTMEKNQFKRIQSVPGIVVSDAIIGIDFPETQGVAERSERYKILREKITNKM